jgi:hypothetical protein
MKLRVCQSQFEPQIFVNIVLVHSCPGVLDKDRLEQEYRIRKGFLSIIEDCTP